MPRTKISLLIVLGAAPLAAAQAPSPLWARQFGAWMQGDRARAAAPDGSGGVYVAGVWIGNAYLARFDSAGTELWLTQLNISVSDHGLAVCREGDKIYVGGTASPLGIQMTDGYVARFNEAGDLIWVRLIGAPQSGAVRAVSPDEDGGVFVTGDTADDLAAPNQGLNDVFIARYDQQGKRLWIRQFGTTNGDAANAMSSDGHGGVYIGGGTNGSLGAPQMGLGDVWFARYDSTGKQLWLRQVGTPAHERIQAMTRAPGGGVHITGAAEGSLAGPGHGVSDAFLGHVNEDGQVTWIGQYGTSGNEHARSIAPDGTGGVYIAGQIFGSWGCPGAGSSDALIFHVGADGTLRWACQVGSPSADYGSGCASDEAGGVYLVGRAGGAMFAPNPWGCDSFIVRYPGPCNANCDQSTQPPALNVADFSCFLQRFAEGHGYANCDLSTTSPVLNVADFACFLQKFAAGCP